LFKAKLDHPEFKEKYDADHPKIAEYLLDSVRHYTAVDQSKEVTVHLIVSWLHRKAQILAYFPRKIERAAPRINETMSSVARFFAEKTQNRSLLSKGE